MSGTPSKMSQSVLDLLKQVRSEGSVGLLLQELERDELGFDWIPDAQEMDGSSGTMADSAKRRLLSEVEETPAPRQIGDELSLSQESMPKPTSATWNSSVPPRRRRWPMSSGSSGNLPGRI